MSARELLSIMFSLVTTSQLENMVSFKYVDDSASWFIDSFFDSTSTAKSHLDMAVTYSVTSIR